MKYQKSGQQIDKKDHCTVFQNVALCIVYVISKAIIRLFVTPYGMNITTVEHYILPFLIKQS